MSQDRRFRVRTGEDEIILIAKIIESAAEKNVRESVNSTVTSSHQGNGNVAPKRDAELQADIEDAWEGMRDFSW